MSHLSDLHCIIESVEIRVQDHVASEFIRSRNVCHVPGLPVSPAIYYQRTVHHETVNDVTAYSGAGSEVCEIVNAVLCVFEHNVLNSE